MLLATATSEATARANTVHVNGHDYRLSGYIGAAPVRGRYVEGNESNDNNLPQGFLVEQPAGAVTPPHFHEVNQFQVIVGGDGTFGKHKVKPVSIHYAGGHTPYGPIASGENGIVYFTLRAAWDPGAKYMPQRRDLLKPVKRQFRFADGVDISDDADLRARQTAASEVIFAPEETGLSGHILRLGPDMETTAVDPATGGGQYHVVVNGTLVREGTEMPLWSCVMVTADEPTPSIRAGGGGLEMLVLQYPRAD